MNEYNYTYAENDGVVEHKRFNCFEEACDLAFMHLDTKTAIPLEIQGDKDLSFSEIREEHDKARFDANLIKLARALRHSNI